MSRESWRVVITRPAERDLKRLPADAGARVMGPIAALSLEPRPRGMERVAGSRAWRTRVGDLRVVYELLPEVREVVIIRIARRSESTYRRLMG